MTRAPLWLALALLLGVGAISSAWNFLAVQITTPVSVDTAHER